MVKRKNTEATRQALLESNHQALLAVVSTIRQSLELDKILQATTEELLRFLSADRVGIYCFEPGSGCTSGEFVAEAVKAPHPSILGVKLQDHCFGQDYSLSYQRGRIWVVEDFEQVEIHECHRSLIEQLGFRACVVVALLQKEKLWGLLAIHQCIHPRQWQAAEIEFLQQISLHLSITIQQAELLVEQRQQTQVLSSAIVHTIGQEKAAARIVEKIRRSLDLKTIFQTTTQEIRHHLNSDRVAIFRFHADWSGEFIIDSVAPGWSSVLQKQQNLPKVQADVNLCSIRDLQKPQTADTYIQTSRGEIFSSRHVYRVQDDIYECGFPAGYLRHLESYQARAYIIVALYKGEQLWGLLATYQNSGPRYWTAQEINFMVQIAEHLGTALQQADLFAQTQHQNEQLQTALTQTLQQQAANLTRAAEWERSLSTVIDKIRRTLDLATIFQTTVTEVQKLLGVEHIAIYRFDSDFGGEFIFESDPTDFLPLVGKQWDDEHLIETHGGKFQQNQSYVVEDIHREGLFSPCHINALTSFDIRSLAVVPLFQGENLWGLLAAFQHSCPRQWPADEVKLLQQVAHHLGVALQQSAYLQQIQDYATEQSLAVQQEKALSQVIDKIRRTLDLETIFQTTATEVRQLLQADRVAVLQFAADSDRQEGTFVAEDVLPPFNATLAQKIEGFCFVEGYAADCLPGSICAIADLSQTQLNQCYEQTLTHLQVKACLVAPLLKGDQHWGLLYIHQCATSRQWQASEIEFASKIAVHLGVALQQAELLAQTQKRSEQLQKALAQVQQQKENLTLIAAQERALTRVIERIRQTLDIETIFETTTQEARLMFNCDRTVVYRFAANWSGEFLYESFAPGWEPLIDNPNEAPVWNDTYLQDTQGGRYRFHESFAVDDIHQANLTPCHIDSLIHFQVRAFALVPVFVGEQLWGLLGAYQNAQPRHWQSRELNLLAQLANQLGVAVSQAGLLSRTKQQSEQLQATLTDLNTIVDNLADGLLVTDILGRITRFNPTLQSMFDLEGVNLIGKHLTEIFPPALAALGKKAERYQQKVVTAEVDLSRGREGQALATSALKESQGEEGEQCLGTVILIRDVTAERELDRMKTDFLATVSHELRTPLTSILGFASIIDEKLNTFIFPAVSTKFPRVEKELGQVKRNLGIIVSESERLTALINDVLDIAKMEAGQVEWNFQPFNVADLIERAIAATFPLFKAKQLRLISDFPSDLPAIVGDENRLLQVIINLLSNTVKFTEKGSVTCRAWADHSQLLISITDTGIGIAENDISKVFERFKQAGPILTNKPKGTGLGLSICQQIVESHGGKIWVESCIGQGSTFFVSLPFQPKCPAKTCDALTAD